MLLEISCNGHQVPVELVTAGGKRRVFLEGRELECDWIVLPNGRYSILLGGKVYDLSVELAGETCSVTGVNGTYSVRLVDVRRLVTDRDVGEGAVGLQRISADMPGKVVRILVQVGQEVEYDQGLLVLEAMKMQNEIRAPKRGVVKEIGVGAGKAVGAGDFLISLE